MRNRRGFTIIELLVVIAVGAILVTITMSAFGGVRSRYAVREARQAFTSLHARTRAMAIESGQTMALKWDLIGDSVWVSRNDTTQEVVNLMDELGVDMTGTGTVHTLCLNSRGFAQSGCTSFSTTATFKLVGPTDTATISITPVGLVSY